jgi:hypothetical protein
MLHFYVLYACVHISAGKPIAHAGETECIERQVFFRQDQCLSELPKRGALIERGKYSLSWLECKQMRAQSWIPADANDGRSRLYQAQAAASDTEALTAVLRPFSPQARASLQPEDFRHPLQRAFQGPGDLSLFIVGNGASLLVFAVTHLDDFQFTQLAADLSSFTAARSDEVVDFKRMAEDAGVELSYHSEMSRRARPPPRGIEAGP